MAHLEPMDIDSLESDYEDKENSILHSNVLSRTPCTEKGYEELDISELNMKLRYSITPASSPMSKSFTANSKDHKIIEDRNISVATDNTRLSSSLNSTLTNDSYKASKIGPLQILPTDQLGDTNRNVLASRSLDNEADNNITITISDNNYENLSIPSTSSSIPQTPEATTPTKELQKDGGSPIMRGLRSVFSIFRHSQSPISPNEKENMSLVPSNSTHADDAQLHPIEVSTPLQIKTSRTSPKRNSPLKDSLVFKDDLEKELQWKDESTILFKEEKIPKHKLLLHESVASSLESKLLSKTKEEPNKTLEYMDISYNDSMLNDKTMIDVEEKVISYTEVSALESDSEFVDCEATYSRVENESLSETKEKGLAPKESKENDELNSVLQNTFTTEIVRNNNSLNATVPVLPPNTSYYLDEENNDISKTSIKEKLNVTNEIIDNLHTNNSSVNKTSSVTSTLGKEILINSEVNPSDSKEIAQVSDNFFSNDINTMVAINDVNNDINIVNNDTVKDSLCENTFITTQIDSVLVKKELGPECVDSINSTSNIAQNEILGDNNSNIEKRESYEFKDTTFSHDNKVKGDLTVVLGNDLMANIQGNNNSTSEVLDEVAKIDLGLKEIDNNISLVDNKLLKREIKASHENSNLSFIVEDNRIEIENIAASTDILSDNSGYDTPISSEGNKEAKDSLLFNENRYFRTSIDTDIFTFNILHNSNSNNDINQGLQINMDSNALSLNSSNSSRVCQKNVSEINIIDEFQSELGNTDYINKTYEKNQNLNDLEITSDKNKVVDTFDSEHLVELPIHITLPSANKQKENNKEFLLKTDTHNYKTDESETSTTIPNIPNTTLIGNNCSVDEISNVDSKTSDENLFTTLKDSIITSNEFIKHNALDEKNEENGNKSTVLQSEELDKCRIVSPPNNSLAGDLNLDKNQTISRNEHLQSMDIEDEVVVAEPNSAQEISNNIPLDISSPCYLETDKNKDIGILPIDEATNPFETKMNLQSSPPLSPSMNKKGYDIDFDNIDNPFATKTKIRQSPTPESPIKLLSPSKGDSKSEKNIITHKKNTPKNKKKTQQMRKSGITKSNVLNAAHIKHGDDNDIIKNTDGNEDKSNFLNATYINDDLTKSETNQVKSNVLYDIDNNNLTIADNIEAESNDLNTTYINDIGINDISTKSNFKEDKSNILNASHTNDVDNNDIFIKSKTKHDINVSNATDINDVYSVDNNNDVLATSDTKENNLKTSTPIADNSVNSEYASTNKSDITKEIEGDEKDIKNHLTSKRVNVSLDFAGPPPRDMTKSVFNCPEINDVKFRSFSDTKRPTSPNSQISSADLIINTNGTSNISSTIIRTEREVSPLSTDKQENMAAPIITNETILSRNTDNDMTREVNTEDEDTATFIEMEELIENGSLENLNREKHLMEFQIPQNTLDSENNDNGELFIDAEAFEFLLNQNKSNIIAESGKESLFLKFDPLFAKRVSSDGIIAALKKVQNKQSTPKKITKLDLDEAFDLPGPSHLETTFDDGNDDASVQAMSKPMMVVNPAINSVVSPRKVITPKINRQSLTFTSPAMAVIDRLLSLSGNNSGVDQNTSSPNRQPSETDVAITQLREMLADKDIHVHNLRSESKELKERLSSLEAQVKALETESSDRLRKINNLTETLVEKTKMNKSMAIVVEEYERTIASLIAQMEQEKKNNAEERLMLIKERDEQTAHLTSMEVSFSDLHSKYEKSKQIIYSMKANEDTYRKSIQEFEESLVKMQNNYELLKQHATSKLNHANQELEKYNRTHEAEILKLNALIKRKELHITSLEETLAQKTKANEELTAICDELINKVG